jgi:hypothetical protein
MVGKKVIETCEEHKERQRTYRARQPSFFERIESNVGDAMFSSRVLDTPPRAQRLAVTPSTPTTLGGPGIG